MEVFSDQEWDVMMYCLRDLDVARYSVLRVRSLVMVAFKMQKRHRAAG